MKEKKLRMEFRVRESLVNKLDKLSREYGVTMTALMEKAVEKLSVVDAIALKNTKPKP